MPSSRLTSGQAGGSRRTLRFKKKALGRFVAVFEPTYRLPLVWCPTSPFTFSVIPGLTRNPVIVVRIPACAGMTAYSKQGSAVNTTMRVH